MKTGNKYAEELSRQLFTIPQRERNEFFAEGISFQSHCSLSRALSDCPLLSLFPDWWFEQFGEPISIVALRETLQALRSILLPQKLLLRDSPHGEDMILQVEELAVHLKRFTRKYDKHQQLSFSPDSIEELTKIEKPVTASYVSNLDALIRSGSKLSTVYADPPWPYRNRASGDY